MTPIANVQMAPSHATLADVRHLLSVNYAPMIPIYHRYPHNIVAIANFRDLLRLEEHKKVIDSSLLPGSSPATPRSFSSSNNSVATTRAPPSFSNLLDKPAASSLSTKFSLKSLARRPKRPQPPKRSLITSRELSPAT